MENILCAKYFPIHIGKVEVGMTQDKFIEEDTSLTSRSVASRAATGSSSSSSRSRKRISKFNESVIGLKDVMKSITSLCQANTKKTVSTNVSPNKKGDGAYDI